MLKKIGWNWTSISMGVFLNLFLFVIAYNFSSPGKYFGMIFFMFYFGFLGIEYTEAGHERVPFLFGGRLPEKLKRIVFKEGLAWRLPWPFMSTGERDVREETQNFPTIEELSKDNAVIKAEVAGQTKIVDSYRSFDVKNPGASLKELAEKIIRQSIRETEALELPNEKGVLSEKISEATKKVSIDRWGLNIIEIYIKSIRLPEELEKELLRQKTEKIQKKSQKTAAETLRANMEIIATKNDGAKRDLSDKDLLRAAQVMDKQIEHIVVDGTAGDFTKGAVVGRTKKWDKK